MRLATVYSGAPDGQLIVLSSDNSRYLKGPTPTLQMLLESWEMHEAAVSSLAMQLDQGAGEVIDEAAYLAPLPRAWQWLDGSAFASHGRLMEMAYNLEPLEIDPPLMYQGMSHRFLAPREDFVLRSEEYGLDFEAEFGVITDAVRTGVTAEEALSHIKLVVMINDWSQRAFVQSEMKRGFGWMHAKPASSVAPVCVTPDELGSAWKDGRVCLDLGVSYNGEQFGHPNGREMGVGFHELISYAAQTRDLPAGTIIGSGTVSNEDYKNCGSACIAERRAIEMIDHGNPITNFMAFGDIVKLETRAENGAPLFGVIKQKVVSSPTAG